MQTAALMLAAARESANEFDRIVRAREAQLLRIAYRVLGNWADAEDVVQDAFLRLHRHGMEFADESALNAWLYRVTINRCIDRSRSFTRIAEMPDMPASDFSAEAEAVRAQQKRRLMQAMATLPAKERAAIVLREIEELSTAEVAAILGSTEGTVRSQVSKAITRLRGLLSKEER